MVAASWEETAAGWLELALHREEDDKWRQKTAALAVHLENYEAHSLDNKAMSWRRRRTFFPSAYELI